MKIKTHYLLFFAFISVLFVSCKDDDDDLKMTSQEQKEYINNWIYGNLSFYYYWNEHIPASPNYNNEPDDFFESLLYKYQTADGDRFSWIQENYVDLLNLLSGYSSLDMGFEYTFIQYENDPSIYARILYVKPGTDAEEKGLGRGMDIATVDGNGMTENNYQTVFRTGLEEYTFGMVAQNGIQEVKVKSTKNYAENPIYLDTIYSFNPKKTGYLVYNSFAADKGDDSYSYDRQLADVFSEFQQEGVVNLVLDLRYNGGGATESAKYIASALVSDRKTSNVFAKYEYNSTVMRYLDKDDVTDYFAEKINNRYSIPTLGDQLENIYIITSKNCASASEMLINGLNPYIADKIIQIGEKTYGKNVASITIMETDDKYTEYNKYGMQPIVAKVSNADSFSDYANGFQPDYDMRELDYPMYDFGNINEPLLGTALRLIADGEVRSSPLRSLPFAPKALDKKKAATDYNMYINPEKLKDIKTFE